MTAPDESGTKEVDLSGEPESSQPNESQSGGDGGGEEPDLPDPEEAGCSPQTVFFLFIAWTALLLWYFWAGPGAQQSGENNNGQQQPPAQTADGGQAGGQTGGPAGGGSPATSNGTAGGGTTGDAPGGNQSTLQVTPAPGDLLSRSVDPAQLSGVSVPSFDDHNKAHAVTPKQALLVMIKTPQQNRVVLDVRFPQDFQSGPQLPGSVNIPLYTGRDNGEFQFNRQFLSQVQDHDRISYVNEQEDGKIFVISDSTPFALRAATVLTSHGVQPAYIVLGGFRGYRPGEDYTDRMGPRTFTTLTNPNLVNGYDFDANAEARQPGWTELGLPVAGDIQRQGRPRSAPGGGGSASGTGQGDAGGSGGGGQSGGSGANGSSSSDANGGQTGAN